MFGGLATPKTIIYRLNITDWLVALARTKAIVAVSHTMAVNFYHMISKPIPYKVLGANYFDTLDRERLTKHTVKREDALGYEVTLIRREVDVSTGRSFRRK